MKIAHLPRRFTTEAWGGTETVILETSRCLQAAGHDVAIHCSSALARPGRDDVAGVPIRRYRHFYPYLGLSAEAQAQLDRKGGNLFSFSLLTGLWRERGLDLVHLHTGKRAGGIGRWVARRRKIPYVVSLHGGFYDVPDAERASWTDPTAGAVEWGRALGWWVGSRRVLEDAAAVICVGREEAKLAAVQLPGVRVEHLPNGVDVARFAVGDRLGFRAELGIRPTVPMMLVMGRIDPQKNQRLAVQLLAALTDVPELHLVLAGPITNPAYCADIERDIDALGVRARVRLVPGIPPGSPRLADAYHAADLVLLPSLHEPFGIAILEAWAAGRPVVAARVGGIPGFVSEGIDAVLADSGDLAGFAAAARGVLADRERALALAAAGRRKVMEEFGWDRVTARLITLYEDVTRAFSLRQ